LLSSNRNEIKNHGISLQGHTIDARKRNKQSYLLLELYSIKNRRTGKYFPVVIRQIACQTFSSSPNILVTGMFFLDPDLVSIPQNQEFGF
jgi:hypothetical protein